MSVHDQCAIDCRVVLMVGEGGVAGGRMSERQLDGETNE